MKAWKKAVLISCIAAGILIPTSIMMLRSNSVASQVQFINGTMSDYDSWKATVLKYPQFNVEVNTTNGERISAYMLVPDTDLPFTPEGDADVVVFSILNTYYNRTYTVYGFNAPNLSGWFLSTYAWPSRDQVIIENLLVLSQTYEG